MTELSKKPVPDRAEYNAFFPSEFSLNAYVAPKTDFNGVQFSQAYTGGKYKVLMIAADERYLPMQNGTRFSTGNHPVETLLPMLHLHEAGFEIDVATLSGNPAKFEMWAMPKDDEAVAAIFQTYLPKLQQPLKLADVLAQVLAPDSPYIGVFIPGGHGAFNALPHSAEVKRVLEWALQNNRHIITLCHGPAALVALAEETCWMSVADALDEGCGSVGTKLELEHTAPTPVGMTVTCESELTAVEGRKLVFKVSLHDEKGPVGGGVHERFIINNAQFAAKAEATKG